MRKLRDIKCAGCGVIEYDKYVDVETMDPHSCGSRFEVVVLPGRMHNVIGDDIPGGLMIENLLTNDDGSPKKYYSKSQIRREAAERGYTWGAVRHTPNPRSGSDKSPNTSRWV